MGRAKINDGLEGNYARRYYLRNREIVRERTRTRQLAHPERGREYARRYRLKKFGPPKGPLTPTGRFMRKVEKVTESGCWIWMGAIQKNGYGRFNCFEPMFAHRFSYEIFKGCIPPGMEIDHLCRVRSCVNPDHLRVVFHAENMQTRC